MRIGVVGASGWAGRRHVDAYLAAGAKVTHLVDHAPECIELANRIGARAVTNYLELIESGVDAASIALPPLEQPHICCELLRAGISVLCEKPVAASAAEAACVSKVAESSSALFMPAFLLRFHPTYIHMKDMLTRGELGHINAIIIESYVKKLAIDGWRLDARMGGIALVNGIHAFDLAIWLSGSKLSPAFAASGNAYFHIPTEDWLDAHLFTKQDGCQTRVLIRCAWWPFEERDDDQIENLEGWVLRVRIEGEKGALIQRRGGLLHLHSTGIQKVETEIYENLFQREIEHFLNCISGTEKPRVIGEDNFLAQALLEETKRISG